MGPYHGLCLLWIFAQLVDAETRPSTVAVPPLQWIRLKPADTNASPALAYPAAGFDYINNQLVVFGGETSGGLIDANTHLLDMSTMRWKSPSPTINKNIKPPGRSRALYGHDLMASYRNGLVIYGGLGQDGPLSDVWEYNFSGQFWYNVTNIQGDIPSARYGATGGGDPPSASNSDPNLLTTFWLTGGVESSSDGSPRLVSYDDIYRFQMSGTVAGNFQNPQATWKKVTSVDTGNASPRLGQAGLVMRTSEGEAKLGIYGGCASTNTSTPCAQQDAHIVGTASGGRWDDIATCPSARIGAAFVPNLNHLFNDMAFLLFGLSPSTNATDVYDLGTRGEIDVLSISQGTWSRVLPSCDPSSTPPCPVPREGAVVVPSANIIAWASGSSAPSAASDIIVFGGKDKDGNVLNDAWILRVTTAQITYTNQTDWDALYGNGVLGSGIGTNGQGVTVEFLPECAQVSSGSPNTPNQPGSNNLGASTQQAYTSGTSHKALAACSVIVIFATVALMRAGQASGNAQTPWLLVSTAFIAWALGIAGFATSFTSTQVNPEGSMNVSKLRRRASAGTVGFVSTGHAIAGCILFALAYIVAPIFILWRQRMMRRGHGAAVIGSQVSSVTAEKETSPRASTPHPPNDPSTKPTDERSASHRIRQSLSIRTVQSGPEDNPVAISQGGEDTEDEPIGAGKRTRLSQRRLSAPSAFLKEQLWPGKSWGIQTRKRERLSSHSSPPSRRSSQRSQAMLPPSPTAAPDPLSDGGSGGGGFVVLNRGKNALDRRTPLPTLSDQNQKRPPMRLGEVSWLERRRNVHMINDLDYAMSQQQHAPHQQYTSPVVTPSTQYTKPFPFSPSDADAELATAREATYRVARFPSKSVILLHCSFHLLLLALSIFTAASIILKGNGSLATPLGAVFIVIVAAFYLFIIILAARDKPEGSVTAVIISRLRGNGGTAQSSAGSEIKLAGRSTTPLHEERHTVGDQSILGERNTMRSSSASRAFMQHRYSEELVDSRVQDIRARLDDDDDDASDIEREMGRRDVSIVTVPKRRLFIANSDVA